MSYNEGPGQNWEIVRRYSDFMALHEKLASFFSKLPADTKPPQLPSAEIQKDDKSAISKRYLLLEKYL